MRKETKEITRIERVDRWFADDGMEFTTEQACREYENSAKGAINAAFKKIQQKESHSIGDNMPYGFGYDDSIYAVWIKDENELKVTNQWLGIMDTYGSSARLGADAIGTCQLIGEYDGSAYVIGTPERMKEVYTKWIDKDLCGLTDDGEK